MEEPISWDDNRPYHMVPMYHYYYSLYIGLQTRVLSLRPDEDVTSVPKPDEVHPSYQSCDRSRELFPIDKQSFHTIYKFSDYYMKGVNETYPIRFIIQDQLLIISFGVGTKTNLFTLDDAIPNPFTKVEDSDDFVDSDNEDNERDNLFLFLEIIEHSCIEHKVEKLLLCGHSHGMRSATVTSFFIECMLDETFASVHNRICGSFLEHEIDINGSIEPNPYHFSKYREVCPSLQLLKRYVIGTGGAPVLFISEDECKSYFRHVEGRYAHIISGVKRNNRESIIKMDIQCSPITDDVTHMTLSNYKYQCYYHVLEHSDIIRYKDVQCFLPEEKQFLNKDIDNDLSQYPPFIKENYNTFFNFVNYLHRFDEYRLILSIFFYGNSLKHEVKSKKRNKKRKTKKKK